MRHIAPRGRQGDICYHRRVRPSVQAFAFGKPRTIIGGKHLLDFLSRYSIGFISSSLGPEPVILLTVNRAPNPEHVPRILGGLERFSGG